MNELVAPYSIIYISIYLQSVPLCCTLTSTETIFNSNNDNDDHVVLNGLEACYTGVSIFQHCRDATARNMKSNGLAAQRLPRSTISSWCMCDGVAEYSSIMNIGGQTSNRHSIY